ncbi:MAG: RNA 2',3'-cyclic phosphodiesterase [Gammaproteobacteria bacterium]
MNENASRSNLQCAATQRMFFALWPDEEVRAAIAGLVSVLPLRGVRPIPPQNIHATLVFLGSITRDTRRALECAVDDLRSRPFELVLDTRGWWRRPQVLWVGASTAPPELAQLVAGLKSAAAELGLKTDPRPYQPHVTIARKVNRPTAVSAFQPIAWQVADFCLVESVTGAGGAAYCARRSWSLADAEITLER